MYFMKLAVIAETFPKWESRYLNPTGHKLFFGGLDKEGGTFLSSNHLVTY